VIVYSPMSSGLLSGKMTRERIEAMPDDDWRKHDDRFREPQLTEHLALVERLRAVAEAHKATVAPWRSRGRCAIPQSTRPSSVSAGLTRSIR
jgi:aryl-alcohol dehydrogenase-like predicted oxidoreductase